MRIGLGPLLLPYYLRRLESINKQRSLTAGIDFAFSTFRKVIRPTQVRSEIVGLLRLIQAQRPRFLMEIGTRKGGTLFLFSRVARDDARLLSIDLPGGPFGGGYPAWRALLYRAFGRENQQVHLIRGDSRKDATLRAVQEILGRNPLDFLLIDGDHTHEGVKNDFERYAPLVRDGGLVAFHDIIEHRTDPACQVHRFWNAIKSRYEHREFIEDRDQGWAGIGVLKMPA